MEFEPFKENLSIPVGGTFSPDPWVWSTGETLATATPVDLTGCSAVMQIREKIDSADVLFTLSTANGRIILGDDEGSVALNISDEDTADIDWKKGVYDLRIEFPSGVSIFFMEGSVVADKKVTRV